MHPRPPHNSRDTVNEAHRVDTFDPEETQDLHTTVYDHCEDVIEGLGCISDVLLIPQITSTRPVDQSSIPHIVYLLNCSQRLKRSFPEWNILT